MFNKENSFDIKKVELNNKRFYKQYNNISITPFFILLLNEYYEDKNMQEHIDFDSRIIAYNNKVFENNLKKQYNKDINILYQSGKIIIDNKIYELNDFYIVYKKNNQNFHLLCTNPNYINSNNIDYDTSVKFIDTTAFIELIKENTIQDNTIILNDSNSLEKTIHNWNGLFHDKSFQTDAIFNKNMIGNDNYE